LDALHGSICAATSNEEKLQTHTISLLKREERNKPYTKYLKGHPA
jgi:hypothetical protein